jgi:curved DNA-binding protein CbpA
MPPRPSIPSDDLYARLELPADCTPEAIEIAWRALLRRHHPDVAGLQGLELAKRINVAHDWLGNPQLRTRYDRERGVRGGSGARRGPTWRDPGDDDGRPRAPARSRPRRREDLVATFLERLSALSPDELDRLQMADPAPIAFGATIRRFLPDAPRVALEAVESEIDRRLSAAATARHGVRDTVHAYAAELVLGPFLDELLSEPFRARAGERLSRGWEAAVGQPRYGPNGQAVRLLIGRLQALDAAGVAGVARQGARERLGDEPWPPGTSPDDDEALRVSSALASRDAAAAVPGWDLDPRVQARARRSAARVAHLLVLRHAFAPAAFEAHAAPWRPNLVPDDSSGPRVRRPTAG